MATQDTMAYNAYRTKLFPLKKMMQNLSQLVPREEVKLAQFLSN